MCAADQTDVAAYRRFRAGLRRTRASRWAGLTQNGVPGMLRADELSDMQLILLTFHIRIEEIGWMVRMNDYVPPSPERSPSPEPMYGADGKRINTRDFRYRKKIEDERHRLVTYCTRLDPTYRPPMDYRRPSKLMEKIYIPVKDYPELNFIGLLLGPRGSTLKQMESESRARIAIRGKGSVKEGKGAPTSYQNQEEDLHCLITADSEEKIKDAIRMIQQVIKTASTVPEAENELKRKQLRDLAALNGTLRDDENQICQNCGAVGHKRYNCPERNNITNSMVCHLCGGAGHMSRDCKSRNNPEVLQEARERDSRLDSEYHTLMAELGASEDTTWARTETVKPKPATMRFAAPLMATASTEEAQPAWPAETPDQWRAYSSGMQMTPEEYQYYQYYFQYRQQYDLQQQAIQQAALQQALQAQDEAKKKE